MNQLLGTECTWMVLNEFESNWLALSARRPQLWIKSSRYTTVCYPVYNPHISYEPFSTFNRGSQRLTARNRSILWCSFSNSPLSGSNFKMKSALFCRPTEREIPCWDHRETIILWRRPGSRELSLLFTTPKLETENRTRNINRNPCLCSNNINTTNINGHPKHMVIRASAERLSWKGLIPVEKVALKIFKWIKNLPTAIGYFQPNIKLSNFSIFHLQMRLGV